MMHIHNDSLPSIGIRLSYSGFHGTVRYVGEVVGTIGTWIGIEWDDPKRGKHDGVKDGVRYFTCKVRNSGSFIRPSSHISYGHSFLEALSFKYIEDPHGAEEQVVLGSSKGAIVVDAVNLDKIREKFAQLDRLREVSLDEGQVARCDVPRGKIRQTCPSIRGLDLSNNLIANWEVVAAIAEELPTLDRLSLNRCRLQVPIDCLTLSPGFRVLQSLHLNDTMMTWSEVQQVAARIYSLRELQFGYNDLESLSLPPPNVHVNDGLQSLYLDSNQLADWEDLCRCLRVYPSLERLNLSSNAVKVIHHATHSKAAFTSLKHLFLSHNKLASWPSIDALAACCANLESLTLTGNTLSSRDDEEGRHSRQLTIAKIPTLRLLDGSAITTKERNDSERFYLTYVMQHSPGPEDERRRAHPRWEDLCNKHGTPEAARAKQNKLSNRLISICLYPCPDPPTTSTPTPQGCTVIRVLPTMPLKLLRLKIKKVLKGTSGNRLWLRMHDDQVIELGSDRDSQDLEWLGIEDSSTIICVTGVS